MFVDEYRNGERVLADFVSWLETQNPDKTYDFMNVFGECAIGQYFAARGISWWENCTGSPLYNQCEGGSFFIVAQNPHTYGALLERAKKVLEPRKL